MRYEKVIRGGTVYNGSATFDADVAIDHGTIAAIGTGLEAAEVVDASGKYVFPGAIDGHVHLQLPFCGTVSADDFENGTKAAACGGVTTVIDFAIQTKGQPLMAAVEARRAEADPKVCVDYSLHVALTDWNERVANEFRKVVIDHGIPTFKMFMIYKSQGWMANDAALYGALELAAELGATAHALSRPAVSEWEAVQRAVTWAEATGGRLYIVHTSTGRSAQLIGQARERGVNVYGETCPQYLLLDDSVFEGERGHLYGTCPQIKKREDSALLWEGLTKGWMHVLATDTCTFTTKQKALWGGDFWKIPFGLPGVETLAPLTYTHGPMAGRFSINRWVELVSENPARLFGLYPRKGVIAPGSDADIVVWDDTRNVTITPSVLQTNCDFSPFEGFTTKGWPAMTFSRGRLVARDGKFTGAVGAGEFLKRGTTKGIEN